MKSGSRHQLSSSGSGFILVSVLLSVTMLLTTATAFAWFARTEMKRAEMNRFILQTRSAAEIACSLIGAKIAADKNGYDSVREPLYSAASVNLELGDFKVSAAIRPLDDKIPISGIFLPDGVTVRKEYEEGWKNVWEYLKREELGTIVLDFMDKDDKQKLGGSERQDNIDRLISDLSELKQLPEADDGLIWGTAKIPGGFDRYFTVYGREKINLNVANPEVIAILDDGIDLAQAKSLAAARIVSPIKSLNDLKKLPGFPEAVVTKLANIFGFESTYFRVNMTVSTEAGRERNYRIILQRSGSSCKIVRWEE